MSEPPRQEGGGCAALIALVIVLALVVAAVISVAALIDPFSWMPSVSEVWADCEEDHDTPQDDCDLANRFPGFWGHVVANLAYVLATGALLVLVALAVVDLREARRNRFAAEAEVERYRDARQALALFALLVGAMAALPIVVAIA